MSRDVPSPAPGVAATFVSGRAALEAALDLLREPRWLPDLAARLGRPPEAAARLVWAMRGVALAVRVGPNVYARAGYRGPALRWCPDAMRLLPDAIPPAAAVPVGAAPARLLFLRGRMLAHLAEPRTLWQVAGHCGLGAKPAARLLGMLTDLGLAVRLRQGVYARTAAGGPTTPAGPGEDSGARPAYAPGPPPAVSASPRPPAPSALARRSARPQPIRDSILGFLREPRSAGEVAAHIRRAVPVATGHLAAMRRLGLVRRLGYSAYCLSTYEGPPLRLDVRTGLLVPLASTTPPPFAASPANLRRADTTAREAGHADPA